MSGICSLAFPASGAVLVLIMAFLLPSRYLFNQLATLLRIYYGIALLLAVPLGIVTLIFFILGIRGLRGDRGSRGFSMAMVGLSLAAVSVALFFVVVTTLPNL